MTSHFASHTGAAMPGAPASETPETIAAWASETFGPAGQAALTLRALDELVELAVLENCDQVAIIQRFYHALRQARARREHKPAVEELADVEICLARKWAVYGADREAEVDRKMQVNRARKWAHSGDGTGQHVE